MKLPVMLFSAMVALFFSHLIYLSKLEGKTSQLDIQINAEEINLKKYKKLNDLFQILTAIRSYKDAHNSYPISRSWSKKIMIAESGINEEWISGLVPTFIKELPFDPRGDVNLDHQYGYISNGAHFKLVAFNPEDCKQVQEEYPQLISGLCHGYGFWSKGAGWW